MKVKHSLLYYKLLNNKNYLCNFKIPQGEDVLPEVLGLLSNFYGYCYVDSLLYVTLQNIIEY